MENSGPLVKLLCEIVFALLGINWVFPKRVKEALISWIGSFVGKKKEKDLEVNFFCIFWTLWKERQYNL